MDVSIVDAICRVCRGNAQSVLKKPKCGVCRLAHKDYVNSGLKGAVLHLEHLWQVWNSCKTFSMRTTGSPDIDNQIERLFGEPHNRSWRVPMFKSDTCSFRLNETETKKYKS